MPLKCGIVGLPNVGKSSIFKVLTNVNAEIANYPFCTVSPNHGSVQVHDERLFRVASVFKQKNIIPAAVEITDIAGLVKGASSGEGLGNQFLSQIREADAICHIVRCFDDPDVSHVSSVIDPVRDIEVVNTELILKDLETVEKICQKTVKLVQHEKQAMLEYPFYLAAKESLEKGIPVRDIKLDDTGREILSGLSLLTSKPVMYVGNIGEKDIPSGGRYAEEASGYAKKHGAPFVPLCAKIEAELLELSEAERAEFLESYGMKEPGRLNLVRAAYKLLGYITFFTGNDREVRAWAVREGTKASRAAGVIHTDFERGFIAAEVVGCDDLVSAGHYSDARSRGLVRTEGRDYPVKDGDVCLFRFNV